MQHESKQVVARWVAATVSRIVFGNGADRIGWLLDVAQRGAGHRILDELTIEGVSPTASRIDVVSGDFSSDIGIERVGTESIGGIQG